MFLKSLEARGFKSFAEKTEIHFKPGINIIVGPNGCGKSNIVEAIRWVLGEGNIRNLRGQKNEDVIFSGSDRKKALGMASVNMILDNNRNILPLDYGEIMIGRRTYRSGESEFFLNQTRVRLKELHHLFAGTGLGKKGYAIIGQGELDMVLGSQGFEKRLMLEEAAGIIKYRLQREEVMKRISATSSEIVPLEERMKQQQLSLEGLRTRAEKAGEYREISTELDTLQRQEYFHHLQDYTQEWEENKRQLQLLQSQLAGIEEELAGRNREMKAEEQELEHSTSIMQGLKERQVHLNSQKELLDGKRQLDDEKARNLQDMIRLAETDLRKNAKSIDKIIGDWQETKHDLHRGRKIYLQKVIEHFGLERELGFLEETIAQGVHLFAGKKDVFFQETTIESRLTNTIKELEKNISTSEEKHHRLQNLCRELELKKEYKMRAREDLQAKAGILMRSHEHIVQDINRLQEKLDHARAGNVKLQDGLNSLHNSLGDISRQVREMEQLRANRSGFSIGVKAIMKGVAEGQIEGIIGVMADLIEVPRGLETALDIALGRGLEGILARDSRSAQNAITFLKKTRQGRATFLPLDLLKPSPLQPAHEKELKGIPGSIGLASSLIRYPSEYKRAIDYLLGRIYVVENMEAGLKVFRQNRYSLRLVTLEGELINPAGAISGGALPANNRGYFQEKARARGLEQEQKNLLQILQGKEREQQELSREMQQLEKRLTSAKTTLMEGDIQRDLLEQEIEQLNREGIALQNEVTAAGRQKAELEKNMGALHDQHRILLQQSEETRARNQKLNQDLEEKKSTLAIMERELDIKKERWKAGCEYLEMNERELNKISENMNRFREAKRSYLQTLHHIRENIRRYREQGKSVQHHLDHLERETGQLMQKWQENEKEIQVLKQSIMRLQRQREETAKKFTPLQERRVQIEERAKKMELKLVRLEAGLEAWIDRGREKYVWQESDLSGAMVNKKELSRIKERIASLKCRIDEIGMVDLDSIAEYREAQEQYLAMKEQFDDIIQARKKLLQIMRETEKKLVLEFKEHFARTSENFNRIFQHMFDGGEAALELETDRDDLGGGMDITVKMPGKRKQPLYLLSGGERALTCIVFIFALLHLKPVPFCVLDEIDTALDETNLDKFARYLKDMAASTQFILVTHRNPIMNIGDCVYGVTMAEEGSSSILSLDLTQGRFRAG